MDIAFIYDEYEGEPFDWEFPFLPSIGQDIFVGDFDPKLKGLEQTDEAANCFNTLGIDPSEAYSIENICWSANYTKQIKPGPVILIHLKEH